MDRQTYGRAGKWTDTPSPRALDAMKPTRRLCQAHCPSESPVRRCRARPWDSRQNDRARMRELLRPLPDPPPRTRRPSETQNTRAPTRTCLGVALPLLKAIQRIVPRRGEHGSPRSKSSRPVALGCGAWPRLTDLVQALPALLCRWAERLGQRLQVTQLPLPQQAWRLVLHRVRQVARACSNPGAPHTHTRVACAACLIDTGTCCGDLAPCSRSGERWQFASPTPTQHGSAPSRHAMLFHPGLPLNQTPVAGMSILSVAAK
jgi:hypothetical protein